jgi:hypothetical protein
MFLQTAGIQSQDYTAQQLKPTQEHYNYLHIYILGIQALY